MAQTTIRLPDDLLNEIDAATDEETSRSEWLRDAARARLSEDEGKETDRRLNRLEERLSYLERLHEFPLHRRLLRQLGVVGGDESSVRSVEKSSSTRTNRD